MNSYYQKKSQAQGSCDFSGTATVTQTAPSKYLWAWTLIHLQFLFTKNFYWFHFSSSLDDWFTAGSSTTCVYPSSRYGFLVLTSNLESLCHSEWMFWFIFTWKEKFSVVIFKIFLTSVECESDLKLPFLCGELCLFRDFFSMPKEDFLFIYFGYRFFILINSACEKSTFLTLPILQLLTSNKWYFWTGFCLD